MIILFCTIHIVSIYIVWYVTTLHAGRQILKIWVWIYTYLKYRICAWYIEVHLYAHTKSWIKKNLQKRSGLLMCLAVILCCSFSMLEIRGRSAVAVTVLARISGKGSNVTWLTSVVSSAAAFWAENKENPWPCPASTSFSNVCNLKPSVKYLKCIYTYHTFYVGDYMQDKIFQVVD